MSDTEYHKGKLRKCFDKEMSFEDGINILKEEYNIPDEDIDIEDEYVNPEEVFFIKGTWYEIINHKQFDPENINDFEQKPNGDVEFMVSFYNGGTCLSEVLEMGINQVGENETINNENKGE